MVYKQNANIGSQTKAHICAWAFAVPLILSSNRASILSRVFARGLWPPKAPPTILGRAMAKHRAVMWPGVLC